MAILFAGGEDIDFIYPAGVGLNADAGFRPDFARHALFGLPGSNEDAIEPITAFFSTTSASFWVGLRFLLDGATDAGGRSLLAFFDGGDKRLSIALNDDATVSILAWDGEPVILATSTVALPLAALSKLDVQITYAEVGRVEVLVDGVSILVFQGDVRRGASTSLSRMGLSSPSAAGDRFSFSEVLIATTSTRLLALKTLTLATPDLNTGWDGGTAEVSDADDDKALATSSNASIRFTSNSAIMDTPRIAAVRLQARVARGSTGPTDIRLGAGANGTTVYAAAQAPGEEWSSIGVTFDQNAVSGRAWTLAEAKSLSIGLQSLGATATQSYAIVTEEGDTLMSEDGDEIVDQES